MTRFLLSALCAAAVTIASPTLAGDRPEQARQGPQVQRVVMLCDTDAATRRGFARRYGAAPVFITADQVMAARASGDTWSRPRCMTAREHARLTRRLSGYAAIR